MRGRGVIAGVLAVCGAIAMSGPARADQFDFVGRLDSMGVYYESMVDVIGIGKELCHELRFGVTPSLVLGKLQRTGFAPTESGIVLAPAVDHMCPDTRPVLARWARDRGYTGPV